MEGISSLQGGHQVAQKLRKTTLPLKSLRVIISSLVSPAGKSKGNEKSRAVTACLKSGIPAAEKTARISGVSCALVLLSKQEFNKITAINTNKIFNKFNF